MYPWYLCHIYGINIYCINQNLKKVIHKYETILQVIEIN